MYVFVRLATTIMGAFLRSSQTPLAPMDMPMRIWPSDLDVYGHVNNGRYLTLMDLGRFDLTIRSGLHRILLKRRWYPVIASAHIQFRKSLHLFNRTTLRTQIMGWDDKWFYLSQTFFYRGEIYAQGMVRAVFLHGKNTVLPKDIAKALHISAESPPLPVWALDVIQADRHARDYHS